jgi:hypothetical protein
MLPVAGKLDTAAQKQHADLLLVARQYQNWEHERELDRHPPEDGGV